MDEISQSTGLPPEIIYFLCCQLLSIACGFLMRAYLSPKICNIFWRHALEIIIGFFILHLCYGSEVLHLIFQAVPAYLIMVFLPSKYAQYGVLFFTMAYLSLCHIYRMLSENPGANSIDITAPLMMQTQKLSSIAFNLRDGDLLNIDNDSLKDSHKIHAIRKRPKLLQIFSYLLCFQNSMVGPFVFFSEYLCFIEGREEDQFIDPVMRELTVNHKEEIRQAKAAFKKQILLCVFHAFLILYAGDRFKLEYFTSPEYGRLGFFRKYFWLTIGCFFLRQRFYFAWSISGAAMLSAGFGFSGFEPGTSKPEHKNAINIHFLDIELCSNTKTVFDSWNIGTTRWLRECVYWRLPRQWALVGTFFISAFWHGFYPIYYLCFLSSALLTHVGRLCRTRLRPSFVGNYFHHCLYDMLTHVSALFCINYFGIGFLLLETAKTLQVWGGLYFLGHLGPLLILFLLPYLLPCAAPQAKKNVVDFSYELNLDPLPILTPSDWVHRAE